VGVFIILRAAGEYTSQILGTPLPDNYEISLPLFRIELDLEMAKNPLAAQEIAAVATAKSIKLGCDERNVSRRLSGAAVFGRVAAGVRVSRDRPWSASAHESRADVSASAWMAGKCVS